MNKKIAKENILLSKFCYSSSSIVAAIRQLKKYSNKMSVGYVVHKNELELEKEKHRAKLNQTRENTQARWNARKERIKIKSLLEVKEEEIVIKKRRI